MSIYNYISSSDSSVYKNETNYVSMSFSMSDEGVKSIFDGSTSYIELNNSPNYNFDYDEDFAVSFYIDAQISSAPIIGKSQQKKINIPQGGNLVGSVNSYGVSKPQYPFEISLLDDELYFKRFDGTRISQISSSFATGSIQHVLCQKSGSELQIWITGSKISSGSDSSSFSTKNDAWVFIGTNGNQTDFFSGSLSQIMVFASALTSSNTVSNLSSSYDNSPNVGNIIYEHGMLIITKPGKYQNIFLSGSIHDYVVNFSSSVELTEQRYRCKIEPDEFDFTYNPSSLKTNGEVKNFVTSSTFTPYITTIGLYNDKKELVAVGKLSQPVKKSKKIPVNFIVKYDV